MKEKLAIFDVDYTITKRETLVEFYIFMLKKNPKYIKYLPKSIFSSLFYVFKIYDASKTKKTFIRFIDGIEENDMKKIVKEFYEKRLSKILYKDAIDTIKKMKKQGYKIYLISASAEFYLSELYNIKEVDKVIGTRFIKENGLHRNQILGENCKGEEKVKRLKEVLLKENIEVDFENSCMFSDSLSDLPLFNLVGHPYLINYKKTHDKIEILRWK
ncbi:HAD-IB family hydrolase [Clostridium estertheticum]|uniref:HAD-IB family hydrolase n=1 Tax=Clostridium estertheticum TaxID=238834 RepID=A0A7Y3SVY8_9CLOT|nr:HAD-IB family hydrolase [Clostridium estertheticum]MBW9170614.1 HAD-IB family hydrolase [Clostridium estertheticum]MBX4265146.1 HAD-IB family hydrolase [Clostridium estertheticum]MBX4269185.1 HAD-IB family hydrolase [Clostridium estertheticum]NNU76023.1 HAD-IB family hydrolase [Clostridium estertheticum]WBL46392.1 HAD-IB family hydrolase [Clostridium estertheticum]